MTIFSRFLPTTFDLSQNWSSDNHFKVLNKSKSWLAQKLWHKIKIFLFLFFCVFCVFACFSFLSYLFNQIMYRTVQHLKMIVWTSVLWKICCQIMTRNSHKMIGKTTDSLLCPLHSIQFLPLVFLPLCKKLTNFNFFLTVLEAEIWQRVKIKISKERNNWGKWFQKEKGELLHLGFLISLTNN